MPGTDLFEVFVFIKNIKVNETYRYGDIELIPYHDYVCLSEISLIDSFINEKCWIQLDFTKNLNSNDRPTAVAHMDNIQSGDGKSAEEYVIGKTKILCGIYSYLTHGNCEIVAVSSLNKTNKTDRSRVLQPIYRGDLLLLADQGDYVNKLFHHLESKDPSVLVYLKLFSEAMCEMDRMARYYKLWMTVVTIAEGQQYEGRNKRDWSGQLVGSEKKLRDCQLVFELFRVRFSADDPEQNMFKRGSIGNVDDFIEVCYQRRCCYAHHRICDIGNSGLCKERKAHKPCASNNIGATYKNFIDDPVLMGLEMIVKDIIREELFQSLGSR